MANIKIIVDGVLMDGHKVSFKAPCDCVTVEKLKVCYVENGEQKTRLFTLRDSQNNDLTGLGNLFSEGAIVYAVLDTVKGYAYLQNAATNKYLEQKITPVDNFESGRADLSASARTVNVLNGKVSKIKTYVGSDGKLHFVDASGADTALNFSLKLRKVGSRSGNGTISATSISGYKNLKASDFIMVPTYISVSSIGGTSGNGSYSNTPTLSYTASSGTITIANASYSGGQVAGNFTVTLNVDVYCTK